MGYIGADPALNESVTSAQIADDAITAAKIASSAVTTAKINADAVTNAKIADGQVDTEHLAALAVETAKIGADAVTNAKIGDGEVDTEHLADDAVDSDEIAAGAVDLAHTSLDPARYIKLQSTTISSATANVELESNIGSTYNHYMIVCSNVQCVSDSTALLIRLKIGGSYLGGSDYRYHSDISDSNTEYSVYKHAGDSSIGVNWSIGNATGEHTNLRVYIDRPSDTDNTKMVHWVGGTMNDNGYVGKNVGCGANMGSQAALTGVRFYFASGDIQAGRFTLYGLG